MIITIENSDGYYATYYDEDEFLQEINVNVIKGIPLTSEILEKNGWKLLKHHKRNSYDDVPWTSYHKPAEKSAYNTGIRRRKDDTDNQYMWRMGR